MKERQPRFIWQDALLVLIIAMNLGAIFLTNYFTATLSHYTQVANNIEMNSFQRVLLNLGYVHFLLQGMVYAFLVLFYLHLRRNRTKNYLAQNTFDFIVLLFFILATTDFVNDLSVVLGVLR